MELTDLRREIDRVDSEILRLLAERMALCDRVAAYKSAHGLPILDEAREEEKLARAAASVPAATLWDTAWTSPEEEAGAPATFRIRPAEVSR